MRLVEKKAYSTVIVLCKSEKLTKIGQFWILKCDHILDNNFKDSVPSF